MAIAPPSSTFGKALELGVQFGACVVVGAGIGWWLDSRFGTEPLLLLMFMFLGLAAGIRTLLRFARQSAPPEGPSEGDSE